MTVRLLLMLPAIYLLVGCGPLSDSRIEVEFDASLGARLTYSSSLRGPLNGPADDEGSDFSAEALLTSLQDRFARTWRFASVETGAKPIDKEHVRLEARGRSKSLGPVLAALGEFWKGADVRLTRTTTGGRIVIALPADVHKKSDAAAGVLHIRAQGGVEDHNATEQLTDGTLVWRPSALGGKPIEFTLRAKGSHALRHLARLRPPVGTDLLQLSAELVDGDVVVLEPGSYPGQLQVAGKHVAIHGAPGAASRLTGPKNGGHGAVFVTEKGALQLHGVTVQPAANATNPVYADKGGRIELHGGAVKGPASVGVVGIGATIVASHVTFEGIDRSAIVVQGGGSAHVTACTFRGVGQEAVVGVESGLVDVRGSTFEDTDGALAVQGDDAGLWAAGNTVTTPRGKNAALFARTLGSVRLEGNRIRGGALGIALVRKGDTKQPCQVRGNAIVGCRRSIQISGTSRSASISVQGNRVAGAAEFALLVDGPCRPLIAENMILVGAGRGLSLQNGAGAELRENTVISSELALNVYKSDPTRIVSTSDLILGPRSKDAAAITDGAARRFEHVLAQADRRKTLLEAAARVRGALLAATDPADGRIWRQIEEPVAAVRASAHRLASLTLQLRDAAGTKGSLPWMLVDETGTPTANLRAGESAVLAAGTYRAAPLGRPDLAIGVDVKEGATTERLLDLDAEAGFFLTMRYGDINSRRQELLSFVSREAAQAVLRGLRHGHLSGKVRFMPRAGTTAEVRARALEAARKTLSALPADPFEEGRARGLDYHIIKQHDESVRTACRILALYGDASDVSRLIGRDLPRDGLKFRYGAHAAFIENRLGTLDHGEIKRRLSSDDPAWRLVAAVQLQHYGSRAGEALLVDRLRAPKAESSLDGLVAAALLASNAPPVLEAMRAHVDRHISRVAAKQRGVDGLWAAVLYLIGYGNALDFRRIAQVDITPQIGHYLSYVVRQPERIAGLLIENGRFRELTGLASTYLPRSSKEIRSITDRIRLQARQRILAHGHPYWRGVPNDSAAKVYGDVFLARIGHVRPTTIAARLAAESPEFLRRLPWVPPVRDAAAMVRAFRGYGPGATREQMDLIDNAALRKAYVDWGESGKFAGRELFLAGHEVGTGAYRGPREEWSDGRQRRVYTVRYPGSGGGQVWGVVEMRPALVGSTLRVRLRVQQKGFYPRSWLDVEAQPSAWGIHRYLVDEGRAMLGAVVLDRGGKRVALRRVGIGSTGDTIYAAALDASGLNNLSLTVRLDLEGNALPLVFPLYDGHFAVDLQRAQEDEKAARAALAANGADLIATESLGRALARRGDLSNAWSAYARVYATDRDRTDLVRGISHRFLAAGLPDQAASALRTALADHADDLEFLWAFGSAALQAGRYAQAEQALASLLKQDAEDDQARVLHVVALLALGKDEAARKAAQRVALEFDPILVPALRHVTAERADADAKARAHANLRAAIGALKGRERSLLSVLDATGSEKAAPPGSDSADRTLAACLAGYRSLLAGQPDDAKRHFETAIGVGGTEDASDMWARVGLLRLGQ